MSDDRIGRRPEDLSHLIQGMTHHPRLGSDGGPRRRGPASAGGLGLDDRETMLRRISLSDPRLLTGPSESLPGRGPATLDPRWQTLVRLGALLATEHS